MSNVSGHNLHFRKDPVPDETLSFNDECPFDFFSPPPPLLLPPPPREILDKKHYVIVRKKM